MATTFFMNYNFEVTQNTAVYAQDLSAANMQQYDYVLGINIAAGGWVSMNQLFTSRVFQQNTNVGGNNNENLVDISLNVDISNTKALLFSNSAVTISSMKSDINMRPAYSTFESGEQKMGTRFLEIVATKIFGHARARAAIDNDSDFYQNNTTGGGTDSIIAQIANGINNAVSSERNNIFNYYVELDRYANQANYGSPNNNNSLPNNPVNYNGNDLDEAETFNFMNTNWDFPMNLIGVIHDGNLLSAGNLDQVNNGPVVGGNQLVNGQYRIPILLRFFTNVA